MGKNEKLQEVLDAVEEVKYTLEDLVARVDLLENARVEEETFPEEEESNLEESDEEDVDEDLEDDLEDSEEDCCKAVEERLNEVEASFDESIQDLQEQIDKIRDGE